MMFHSGFILLGLIPLLLVGGLIALVVWAITRQPQHVLPAPPYGQQAQPMPPHESPLDILARRFAAGEISADEYQKARDLLKGDSKS
ncbi:MAG: SHOCT domain-containing protein [Chloroflexi bacterium]|nr:MAG: SHOCT domain-containing protein [Chloroflexota bacterium]